MGRGGEENVGLAAAANNTCLSVRPQALIAEASALRRL